LVMRKMRKKKKKKKKKKSQRAKYPPGQWRLHLASVTSLASDALTCPPSQVFGILEQQPP